jgi:NTE family protein
LIALVLSGGGARGAYQVGVLRRVAEMRPDLPFSILSGSSAGSVNVSYLASRADAFAKAADSLARLWAELTVDRIYRTGALSLSRMGLRWLRDLTGGGRATGTRARSLLDTAPLAQLIDEHVAFESIQPLIDRRLLHAVSVTATSYTTGQSVSFVQGGPTVLPWGRTRRIALLTPLERAHVLASCAIPFLFPAVQIGDAHYGDGNVRLGNPFSPPARLGASRIFAVSTRHPVTAAEAGAPAVTGYPPPAQVAGVLLNSIFLDSFDDDAGQLLRVNSLLGRSDPAVSPGNDTAFLRPIELLVIAPSRDLGRLATQYQHHFPPVVRWLLRGVGAGETESADLVSYLLFDRAYTQALLDIGYADATAHASEIERFLAVTRS